jgi:hypothetical protein
VAGLILLVLFAIAVAYGYTRLRGRMGLNISARNWIAPIVVVVILLLLLWATATHGGH